MEISDLIPGLALNAAWLGYAGVVCYRRTKRWGYRVAVVVQALIASTFCALVLCALLPSITAKVVFGAQVVPLAMLLWIAVFGDVDPESTCETATTEDATNEEGRWTMSQPTQNGEEPGEAEGMGVAPLPDTPNGEHRDDDDEED